MAATADHERLRGAGAVVAVVRPRVGLAQPLLAIQGRCSSGALLRTRRAALLPTARDMKPRLDGRLWQRVLPSSAHCDGHSWMQCVITLFTRGAAQQKPWH